MVTRILFLLAILAAMSLATASQAAESNSQGDNAETKSSLVPPKYLSATTAARWY